MVSPSRMTAPLLSAPPALHVLLAFNANNQLAVRQAGTRLGLAFVGADEAMALARLETAFPAHTTPTEHFNLATAGPAYRVFFTQIQGHAADPEISFRTLDELQRIRAT